MFLKFLYVGLAIFFAWQLFAYVRSHPEAFSKKNLSSSFFTIGVLALILMAFIAGLVFFVKSQ